MAVKIAIAISRKQQVLTVCCKFLSCSIITAVFSSTIPPFWFQSCLFAEHKRIYDPLKDFASHEPDNKN